ncbi:MAG: hypothetical protein JWN44_5274 [Myxococcales bacterium]|nr:hypothetical protein [Myxococcales bacterium]
MRGVRLHILVTTLFAVSGCGSSSVTPADFGVALDMHILSPTPLATVQTMTTCLAVDGAAVYWADYLGNVPTIQKASLDGASHQQLAAGGDKNGCVAVDVNGVYYVEGDKIMKVALDGAGAMALALGQHVLRGPVTAGGYVYWITDVYGNVDAYNGKNAIVRLSTSSAGPVEVVSAEVVELPGALVVDDASVYYSDASGAWSRALAAPATATAFGAQSTLHTNSMAAGGGRVAVAEVQSPGAGDIALFRTDGMGRVVVSPSVAQPLAVDAKGVYVKGASGLERLALDGSGSTLLASETARALVLSSDRVYFTDGARIYSLSR